MAEIRTKPGPENVEDYISNLPDETKRKDSFVILEMMRKAVGEKPQLWGGSLIGFGNVRIKSPSGREVDWFKIGFAPRKANLSLYLAGDMKKHGDALKKLGKHKTGVGCLYINKLEDIDVKILKDIIESTLKGKK
jgi:hypothetical protein